jgi:hypothetical protein
MSHDALSLNTPTGSRIPGWLVILDRQPAVPNERRIAAFAQALKIDEFTARQRLSAPSLRILRREAEKTKALEWRDWLQALDIRGFMVGEEELAAMTFLECTAAFADGGMLVFEQAGGERVSIPAESVACFVLGDVRERTITEHVRPGMMWDEESPEERRTTRLELILDVHRRDARESIRLRQDSFQFQRVFPGESSGSTQLMRRLAEKLRRSAPHAPLREDFTQAQALLGDSMRLLSEETKVVLNWRRVGRTVQRETERHILDSNVPVFDLYSALVRFGTLG